MSERGAVSAQPCPSAEALTQALGQEDAALQAHLAGCARCREEQRGLGVLQLLTREIALPEPTAERVEAVRTRVLLAAPRRARQAPRRAVLVAALGLCAAALLVVVLLPRGHLATVQNLGPASFTHEELRHDEVVRLREGTIQVAVARLRRGERFRVQVGQSEVEVRGTAFQVTATRERLERVHVLHGAVEVRPAGRAAVVLHDAQEWVATSVEGLGEDRQAPQEAGGDKGEGDAGLKAGAGAAPMEQEGRGVAPAEHRGAPERPASKREPSRGGSRRARPLTVAPQGAGSTPEGHAEGPAGTSPPSPSPAEAPRPDVAQAARPTERVPEMKPARPLDPTDPADQAFASAMQAAQARDFVGAARHAQRALTLAGERPIAEDAAYWLGVMQGRAGQRAEAARSLRAFVERYPRAPRTEEASVILGWLLLRDGALAEAERRFQAAARAPFRNVRESAAAGLRAVAARRAAP